MTSAFKYGLFRDNFETDSYKANAFYAYDDFFMLGIKAELPEVMVRQEIQQFVDKQ